MHRYSIPGGFFALLLLVGTCRAKHTGTYSEFHRKLIRASIQPPPDLDLDWASGEGADRDQQPAIWAAALAYFVVFYRIRIGLDRLQFQESFRNRDSDQFRDLQATLGAFIDRLFQRTPGQQYATLVRIEKRSAGGSWVTFDISSSDYSDDQTIRRVLEQAINARAIGDLSVTSDRFEFNRISDVPACTDYQFQCQDSSCIDIRRKCDGVSDCADGSDENRDYARCNSGVQAGAVISYISPETTVSVGQTLELLAVVDSLGSGTVSWVRQPDDHVLTSGSQITVYEPRLSVDHEAHSNRYVLRIKNVHPEDATRYDLWVDLGHRKLVASVEVRVTTDSQVVNPRQPKQRGNCQQGHYQCRSGHCLQESRWCDGIGDCPDRDDEAYCDRRRGDGCLADEFVCHDGQCIDSIRECDGYTDCSDGSDELRCHQSTCEFQCADGSCIRYDQRCNGRHDCADGTDEVDCRDRDHVTCEFRCADGSCIRYDQRCNGLHDCADGTDEVDCRHRNHSMIVHCRDGTEPELSLYGSAYCWSDNVCPPNTVCQDDICCFSSDNLGCQSHQFACLNGECIDKRRQCDHTYDCQDGTDELNCHYKQSQCEQHEFMCEHDKRCIDARRKCDGFTDCSDGSDERLCVDLSANLTHRCTHREFRCNSGHCIPKSKQCDRHYDCADGTDEIHCAYFTTRPRPPPTTTTRSRTVAFSTGRITETRRCSSSEFRCRTSGHCVDIRRVCDRYPDCHDRSDEFDCEYHYHDSHSADIHIDVRPQDQRVKQGQSVTVDCTARGNPQPVVRWTKVGGPLPPNARDERGRLYIAYAEPHHSGTYVCVASSNGNSVEGFTQITVETDFQQIQGGSGNCMADEKTCRNGECVKADYVCDGEYDCRDRSDEDNCPPPRPCEPNEFRCNNNRCVQKMWVCDGDDDCGDRSDEQSCGTRGPGDVCDPTHFKCETQQQCVPSSFQCDAQNDCFDGSDEKGCRIPQVTEPPPPGKEVTVGEVIILRCVALGVPTAHINWRKNWGPVCGEPRCTQTSVDGVGVLTIRDAIENDSGAYTCEAINVKGRVLAVPDCIVVVRPGRITVCNRIGTIPGGQPDRNGQCPCKQYVTGLLCDQCMANAFYMHQLAPYGCLRCFCSGVTKDCSSYRGYRTQERLQFSSGSAEGVTIADFNELRVTQSPRFGFQERNMVTYDGPFEPTVYFRLPQRLLGDKISAYGGKLEFKIKYTGGRYGSGAPADPLVVLKGNEIALVHRYTGRLTPDSAHTISIQMYENNWQREDGGEADREHLLMTLADLDAILIRASHVAGQSSCSLGDISLDIAVDRDTQQEQALAVEQCRCPEGYKGLSCEDCADGFERSGGGLYLGTCIRATADECDLAGSLSTEVDPATGQCRCKAYTMGPKCDQCKPNSFYFHAGNPYGCLNCFCSGITRQCSSSSYYITQERMSFSSGQVIDVRVRSKQQANTFRPQAQPRIDGRRLVFDDFSEVSGHTQVMYWEMPRRFLGDKITSYGSKLKFTFSYSGTGQVQQGQFPMVIIRGNDIALQYIHRQPLRADEDNIVEIPLYEDRWKREDGADSTREHLLMTLADLNVILIRMTHGSNMDSSSLTEVSLDYAVDRDTQQSRAHAVEQCSCPPGYRGTSCQWCASGFSRTGGGLYLGLCEKCECNGHATECDTEYGFCIDCQHNTEGDRCERCKPGYTGDARRGTQNDCTPIKRPTECECHHHSPRGCDSVGRCLLCEHFTEGFHCEKCKRGYYGDATQGTEFDCTLCPCPGERECYLDTDGQVTCRGCPAGFSGRLCDECGPGYIPDPDAVEPLLRCKPYDGGTGTPKPPAELKVEIIPPKKVTTEVGGTASWECVLKSGGDGAAYTLAWTRPGYSSLPRMAKDMDGILTITDVTLADGGRYRCTASSPTSTSSDDAELTVIDGGEEPYPTVSPSVQTITEGKKAEFVCMATGDPPPVITWGWDRPGGPLRPDILQENGRLIIPRVRKEDAGRYHCTASNKYGTNTAEVTLHVDEGNVPPEITIEPGLLWEGEVGSDHEFRCVATGSPPPQVSWEKPDGTPFPDNIKDLGNGVLKLENVKLEDAGQCRCVATNLAGRDEETVTVRVLPELHVHIDPSVPVLRIPEGTALKLKCTVWGTPEPTLEWIHDVGPCRGDVPEGCTPVVVTEEFIRHDKVSAANSGEYRCRGNNGQMTKDAVIFVEVIPKSDRKVIVVGGSSQQFAVGSTAELRCTAPGPLSENVRWVRLDGELPANHKMPEPGLLVIEDFQAEDAGEYECQAYGVSVTDVVNTMKVTIYVSGTAGRLVYVDGPSVRVVEQGDALALECAVSNASLRTSHMVYWTYERFGNSIPTIPTYDGGPMLHIKNIRPMHSGVYTCLLRQDPESVVLASASVTVVVTMLERKDVKDAEYSWHFLDDGVEVVPNGTVKEGMLTVSSVTGDNDGLYRCTANDADGDLIGWYWVSIVVSYGETPMPQDGEAGAELELTCPVYALPGYQISWERRGGDMPDKAKPDGRYLKIPNFQEEDQGVYVCKVEIGEAFAFGYISATIVETQNMIQVQLDVSNPQPSVGSDVYFTCLIQGDDTATITWERQGGPMPDNAKIEGNRLEITALNDSDQGTYRCLASTQVGPLHADAVLVVGTVGTNTNGQVILGGQPMTAAVGMEARIHCPAETAKGFVSEITWSKGDDPLLARHEIKNGVLIIREVQRQDAGIYTCTMVTDRQTRVSLNVSLHVADFVPSFEGYGFVELPPLPAKAKEEFEITLSFKPDSEDGLLFYTSKEAEPEMGDFVSVGLRDNKLVYRFDVGGGAVEIQSDREITLDQWHTVTVKRVDNEGTLIVDGEHITEGVAQGTEIALGIGKSTFLGGLDDFDEVDQTQVGFGNGFEGIISELVVNGVPVDMGTSKISYAGVRLAAVCSRRPCEHNGQCVPAHKGSGYRCLCKSTYTGLNCEKPSNECVDGETRCQDGMCVETADNSFECLCPINKTGSECQKNADIVGSPKFDGKYSFLTYALPTPIRTKTQINFKVKPESSADGVLFYAGNNVQGEGDFLGVAIKDGALEFTFDSGDGVTTARSEVEINPSEWYDISVERDNQDAKLTVNGESVEVTADGESFELSLNNPLFIGGTWPGVKVRQEFGVIAPFHGCIKSPLLANGEELNLITEAIDSAQIEACEDSEPKPDACADSPCDEGATCVVVDEGFECHCSPGKVCGSTTTTTESPSDQCADIDCGHGDCKALNSTHTRCDCQVGWSGDKCGVFKPVEKQAHFNGKAWVELSTDLMPHLTSEKQEIIELKFKTTVSEGVLLWHGQNPETPGGDQDYLSLGIDDGYLVFSYELGGGPSEIASSAKVNDGNTHHVILKRTGRTGEMQIDSRDPVTGSSSGILAMLNTEGNIYVGGVPDLEVMTGGIHETNFDGCIADLKFDGRLIDFMETKEDGVNIEPCEDEMVI